MQWQKYKDYLKTIYKPSTTASSKEDSTVSLYNHLRGHLKEHSDAGEEIRF